MIRPILVTRALDRHPIRLLAMATALLGVACLLLAGQATASERMQFTSSATTPAELRFEENRGQIDERAQFSVRGFRHSLFITRQGPVFSFRDRRGRRQAVRLTFLDANPNASSTGNKRLPGYSNYLRQPETAQRVPSFAEVRYDDVYTGVDLVYYGTDGKLEYDFVLAPGADPDVIRMRFEGAESLSITEEGDLLARVAGEDLRQRRPVVYQEVGGTRVSVQADYVVEETGDIRLALAEYDASQPLVIDPVVDFSSYLGRDEDEAANAVAVDAEGNVYVTGSVESTDFPVSSNAFLNVFGGDDSDAFVSKFRPDGASLEFSTFLGSESNDAGTAIVVDNEGEIYVTGFTSSNFFPVDGFQTTFGGVDDCFVTKLRADGAAAVFSTYLGHGDEDRCNALAIDSEYNVYVAGFTRSLDFPTTSGAVQTTTGGGIDAFMAKISAGGDQLLYSTFLGGGGDDVARGLAVDGEGSIYVVGDTKSVNFPISADARQGLRLGDQDAYLSKISADGSTLVYSSFHGGSALDVARGVALDSGYNVYVGGMTGSADFPSSTNASQQFFGGGDEDGFVTKFDSSGSGIRYSTFLGGSDDDAVMGIAVDGGGAATVVGVTDSDDFPLTLNALLLLRGGDDDGFVTTLNSNGTGALHSSFFGGGNDDAANTVALDSSGNIYFAGHTKSDDFPLSIGAFQTTFNDGGITDIFNTPTEAFVVKLSRDASDTPLVSLSSASFWSQVAAGSIVSTFGIDVSPTTASAETVPLPTTLGGVTVRITDSEGTESDASLFFVSPGQLNLYLSEDLAIGEATMTVFVDGVAVASGNFFVREVAPGLYAMNANGEGVAAALVTTSADPDVLLPVFREGQDGVFDTEPITISDSGQTVLVLFGTGLRAASEVTVTIDGEPQQVTFFGPQGQFVGLDQINVVLDPSLKGRGEVEVVITADGHVSNIVTINIL